MGSDDQVVPQSYPLWGVVWKEREDNPDAFPPWERPLDFPDEDWEMSLAQFAAKTDQELADGLDKLLTISRIVAWVVDPMRPGDGACPVTMDGVAWTEWEAGTAEEVRELVLARLRSERDAAWSRMEQDWPEESYSSTPLGVADVALGRISEHAAGAAAKGTFATSRRLGNVKRSKVRPPCPAAPALQPDDFTRAS